MKVSIIGAGNVGAQLAMHIAQAGLADVVLLDVASDLAQAKALDIGQAIATYALFSERRRKRESPRVSAAKTYKEISGSEVVVITAGLARKTQPGAPMPNRHGSGYPCMSREDLLKRNAEIIKGVVEEVAKAAPLSIIVVVTNPVDAMAYLAYKISGFPSHRIIGMGGALDSGRLAYFLAKDAHEKGDSALFAQKGDSEKGAVPFFTAVVIGAHGDTMVALDSGWSKRLGEGEWNGLVGKTRNAGAEIVSLLKEGSAYFAPASAAFIMVRAILKNEHSLVSASCWPDGAYGLRDLYIGLPVRLGRRGVEEVVEVKLSDGERQALFNSAESIREMINLLG